MTRERVRVAFDRGLVALAAVISWTLRVVDGPAVFPVEDDRGLGRVVRAGDLGEHGERVPHVRYVGEYTRVLVPDVVDDRAVELLARPATLAPLEVLHRVAAVGDREHAAREVCARALSLADREPVRRARDALHEKERRSAFAPAHEVMGGSDLTGE